MPMAAQYRGAFIRNAAWPPANESTYQALRAAMPDTAIDLIEVRSLLRGRPALLAANMLATLRHYGAAIIQRRHRLREAFFRTPYLHRATQRLLGAQMAGRRYDFSFQMQALFDASQPGVPHFLYTDHTHLANLSYPSFDRRRLYAPAWIALERAIYRHAEVCFTRSSNIRDSLIGQYGHAPQRAVCVYAGSNTQVGRLPLSPQKYASRQVLFVGMDWERKGGPELVAAMRRVQQEIPDAGLTVVGCAPALDLPNSRALGRLPLAEVDAFYEQAAVFCLPTKLEPFGIVFVEAMAHGLPLVAMRTGAVPDFVLDGENGALLEMGDVDGLARALIDLLGEPERCRAYGAASARLADTRYNWSHVAQLMRAHIEAVVGRRPALGRSSKTDVREGAATPVGRSPDLAHGEG